MDGVGTETCGSCRPRGILFPFFCWKKGTWTVAEHPSKTGPLGLELCPVPHLQYLYFSFFSSAKLPEMSWSFVPQPAASFSFFLPPPFPPSHLFPPVTNHLPYLNHHPLGRSSLFFHSFPFHHQLVFFKHAAILRLICPKMTKRCCVPSAPGDAEENPASFCHRGDPPIPVHWCNTPQYFSFLHKIIVLPTRYIEFYQAGIAWWASPESSPHLTPKNHLCDKHNYLKHMTNNTKKGYFWFKRVTVSLKKNTRSSQGWKTPFRPSGSCLDVEILKSDPQTQPIRHCVLHVPHTLPRFAGPGLKKVVKTHLQGQFPFRMCPGQLRHRAIKIKLVKAGKKKHFPLVFQFFPDFSSPIST